MAKQAQPKKWTFKVKQPWGDTTEYEVGFSVRTVSPSEGYSTSGYYACTITLRIGEVADTYAYNHWKELCNVRFQANHGEEVQAPTEPTHALPVFFEREEVARDKRVYVRWYGGSYEINGGSDYATWKENVNRFQMVWERILSYRESKGLQYKWPNDAPGATIDALLALGAQPLEYNAKDYCYRVSDSFPTWMFR